MLEGVILYFLRPIDRYIIIIINILCMCVGFKLNIALKKCEFTNEFL